MPLLSQVVQQLFAPFASAVVAPMMFGINWLNPDWLLAEFGTALFWIGLVMIFVECGLFFPFLPGDTLLFAFGLFIGTDAIDLVPGAHQVDLVVALVLMIAAAFGGNVAGYEIGRRIGPRVYARDGRLLKREYLDQTSEFFEKYGSRALVIGRFVPFVRTFITLVAGVTRMDRHKFFVWSGIGALIWVVSITLLGYFLGQTIPWLGDNIDYVTIGLLAVTAIPISIEWVRARRESDSDAKDAA